ncbi:MAG: RdgB/HAM1 family non-canonical purine NTP pyrophosphatase [Gammaproteobacteria bacterium]|nr:RdgB/HAM1 family non-canonical purine NTP pyrophosphatase [Gammaproteobacteria bacterium]
MRIVLATGNAGKIREFSDMLGPLGFEFVPQSELGIEPPEETGETFEDNALLKARHAAAFSGLPAMADDSGLEVDALGGAPGVRSARYAGEGAGDLTNVKKLLEAIQAVPEAARSARFRCVIALARTADDPSPAFGRGVWEGVILRSPRGYGGFGYDPVFSPRGETRSVAELTTAEKHAQSHRGSALRDLHARLRSA